MKVNAINALISTKRDLIEGDDSAKIRIEKFENDLQALNLAQHEASKIRSQAQWLEDGEKPTKYFFSLETTRADKNSVKVIYNSDGHVVSSQREIEDAQYDFYPKLYSKEPVDFQIQREFLSNLDLNLLDDDVEFCERILSADEITQAVRSLSQGKTPGSNGLPQEFYIKFGIVYALFY